MTKAHSQRSIILFIIFSCWLVLILTDLFTFSRWAVAWRTINGIPVFDARWLLLFPLLLSLQVVGTMWRKDQRLNYGDWAWFLVPFIVSSLCFWEARGPLRNFLGAPSVATAGPYLSYQFAFLLLVLIWMVGFPYEKLWLPRFEIRRTPWAFLWTIGALLIAGAGLAHGIQLVNPYPQVRAIQSWMQVISIASVAFLTIRIFLPLTIAVLHSHSPADPNYE